MERGKISFSCQIEDERNDEKMIIVLFTGGGTSGHITPNIAIIEELRSKWYATEYIGMKNSIEEALITKLGITVC